MTLTLNNTNTLTADNIIVSGTDLSDLYATKTELGDINTANSSNIATNTADIAVLNTKQLQNFHNISSVSHLLDTDYQTNATLTSTFYNKTEIDTTFTNYYTQTQIDTNLSTNYQTNTQLGTNYYNKTEVDGLIAGAGGGDTYTTTEVDNLLALRVPVSDFTNRFSPNPIIDCSAPTVIHSGLTLNNSTINISPVAGFLFSNQTGGGDKVLAEFKNATSYITLQGDKIFCNNTSDNAIKQLDLSNNNAGYKMSGKIEAPTGGLVVENTADGNLSFTVRNTDNYITFNNDNIDCYNSVGDTGRILNLNNNANQYVKSHSLLVDTGANTLTGGYTLDVVDSAIVRQSLKVDGNLDLTNDLNFDGENANVNNSNGLTFYKNTTDASNVLTIKNAQGYLKFNSFNINAYNTSNDSSSLLLLNTANGNGVYCLSLGIGAIQGANKLNVSGGNANFGGTSSFQNISTFNSDIYVNNSGRIFQRIDANNSLNVISTEEINFSLQSNRTTDPTTSTIALQLNDTNGITLNRATTINQNLTLFQNLILNSGNNTLSEALVSSSYDMLLTNSDTNREIRMRIGTDYGQLRVLNAEVKVMEHLQFTHATNATSEEITVNNTDIDGKILLEVGGVQILGVENDKLNILDNLRITQETITATYEQIQFINTDSAGEVFFFFGDTTAGNEVLEISPGGVYIDGTFGYSSDFSLKDNIKEISSKKCYEIVKYVKPKTFNFTHLNEEKNKVNHLGYVAQDLEKVIPKEWEGIITTDNKGHKRLDYCKTAVITHGAVQELIKEVEELTDLVKTMKKEITALKGELTKLKNKSQ